MRPPENETITRRQFLSLCFISLLSPIMRRVPGFAVEIAGSAGWLAPVASALPFALFAALICWFLRKRRDNEGMGGLILRSLGLPAGKFVLAIIALWLFVYTGLVVRFGIDRLTSTIYPDIKPYGFMIIIFLALLPVTLGELKPLARLASVFRPVIILMFAMIFLFVLPNAHIKNLLPVSSLDILPLLSSIPPVMSIFSVIVLFTFLMDNVEKSEKPNKYAFLGFGAGVIVCTTLVIVTTVATFGPELTPKFSHPFFAMVRNISILGTIERVESIIAGLWVAVDFVLSASLLCIIVRILLLIFPALSRRSAGVIAMALSAAAAFSMPKSTFITQIIGSRWIPATGAALFLGLIPLSCLIGKIRKVI